MHVNWFPMNLAFTVLSLPTRLNFPEKKDKLQHKGSTSDIVHPKQVDALYSQVAIPR